MEFLWQLNIMEVNSKNSQQGSAGVQERCQTTTDKQHTTFHISHDSFLCVNIFSP